MKKQTIRTIDFSGKKVLLRVDFNVPINEFGVVANDKRIKEELPTINYMLAKGASIIIISHLGRPEGKVVKKYSLIPCAKRLADLLHHDVKFASDCVGPVANKMVQNLKPGEILMLENLRFQPEEENDDENFAKKLASYADIYVNDAFGVCHRKHASIHAVAKYLPNAIGFLIEKEVKNISQVLNNPDKPFIAILGGAKVSDKLGVISSLIEKCDAILIGGAMAYTFLKAQGYNVGKSKVETDLIETAKDILNKANKKGVKIVLPVDNVYTNNIKTKKIVKTSKTQEIPDKMIGVDIGKKTLKLFKQEIKKAKTILWNGPLGIFEEKMFSKGTYKVAKMVSKNKGFTVVGGGDSASAIINMGFENKISHVSTGGGASLKMFEGKVLPGIDAISNEGEEKKKKTVSKVSKTKETSKETSKEKKTNKTVSKSKK